MRVAFFTDTFEEINGVALTSRQFTDFAKRREYPFLCIRGSAKAREYQADSVSHLELARGPLAFELDRGLRHDPALWLHREHVWRVIKDFRPDIVHVVSPGDVSEIGVYIAKRLKLPLAISWHTNLHEFGAMRLGKMLWWMPEDVRRGVVDFSEAQILNMVLAFYRMGDVLYAPNDELVTMLRERLAKPVFLMKRGIDTEMFTPQKRTVTDGILRLGYVGRITPEKSVRFLRDMEIGLKAYGVPPFRFLIVGDGSEREWLRQNLEAADLPGIQRGEDLARAYANMDVFVFPSRTDTFGNVVLEAFASGVPAVVTDAGGPKFIVNDGVSGFVARNDTDFIERTASLLRDPALRAKMADAARLQALGESWDTVFERSMKATRLRHPFEQRLIDIKWRRKPEPFDWYRFDTFANLTPLDALFPDGLRSVVELAGDEPVADIGAGDGDLSFLFESLGCKVTALDWPGTNANRMEAISLMKRELNSSVEIRAVDIDNQFALDGDRFGVVLSLGLLYHLRNPFYFLEKLASHSRHCVLSTAILPRRKTKDAIAYLARDREYENDSTNYWFFSEAGVLRLLDRCGWDVKARTVIGSASPRFFCHAESRLAKTSQVIRLLEGWHEMENRSWRWTKREFAVVIENAQGATRFELRFRVVHDGPLTVQAEVNGEQLESRTWNAPGDYVYSAAIAPATRRNLIRVRLSEAFETDGRELGVIVMLPAETIVDETCGFALTA